MKMLLDIITICLIYFLIATIFTLYNHSGKKGSRNLVPFLNRKLLQEIFKRCFIALMYVIFDNKTN